MSGETRTEARWPDQFVYVCTAGGGANVNVAPMLHAGAGRVAGLVVMVPVTDRVKPSGPDRAQAILPAERLEAYARRVLRLPEHRMRRVWGHPDLLGSWTGTLTEAATLARELDAEIVFNITGGRKPATLGAILGQGGAGEVPVSLISIGVSSFTVRLVRVARDGTLDERPLPTSGRAGLDDYLASYGYRAVNRDAQLAWTDWMRRQNQVTRRIQKMTWPERQAAFRATHRATYERRRAPLPFQLSLPENALPPLGPIIDGLEGAVLACDQLTIETNEARRFLAGHWLEALILGSVEARLGSRSDLQIFSGIEIARDMDQTGRNRSAAETEFDLVILGDDRLDLVEAKAGADISGLHDAITKLGHYRTLLSGPAGAAWLVTPLVSRRILDEYDLLAHAEAEGVNIYSGDGAVGRLVKDLNKRYPRRG